MEAEEKADVEASDLLVVPDLRRTNETKTFGLEAEAWVAGREREYADAKRKHDLRFKKLELEVEKLELEVEGKRADLTFSEACTRMKLAEASVLEAKAQLEWELVTQERARVEDADSLLQRPPR